VAVFTRLCLVLGGVFVVTTVVYWSLQHDRLPTSLLAMVAVGFIFIGLYMATALRKARRQQDIPETEEAHVRGTIWPAVFALSAAGFTLGVLVTPWLLVAGGILFAAAGVGWTAENRRQWGGGHPAHGEHAQQDGDSVDH
jgi:uncharacterized membrane protein